MTREARPLYARVLRLRHLRPSSLLCFLFFEGMIALGVLLALAELVTWWAVPVLPAAVAGMVKVNDIVAGALATGGRRTQPSGSAGTGSAGTGSPAGPAAPGPGGVPRMTRQVSRDLSDTLDPADSPRQRFRQSARRRYR